MYYRYYAVTAVSKGTYHVDDNATHYETLTHTHRHTLTHTHRIYNTTYINNIIMTKVIRCKKHTKLLGLPTIVKMYEMHHGMSSFSLIK